MAFRNGSTTRKVVDYLAKGNTLTEAQASAKFGVQNLSATISHIKPTVERYGNHEIFSETTARGTVAYGMDSFN